MSDPLHDVCPTQADLDNAARMYATNICKRILCERPGDVGVIVILVPLSGAVGKAAMATSMDFGRTRHELQSARQNTPSPLSLLLPRPA